MVPGPPMSLQLCGATLLRIRLMSASSMVGPPRLDQAPLFDPWLPGALAKEPLPVDVPTGVPDDSELAPVTGVGAAVGGGVVPGLRAGWEVGWLTSPKSCTGMT